jgi:hypothetical protein
MKFFLYAHTLENRKIVINIINRISRRYYRSIGKFMEPPDKYLERLSPGKIFYIYINYTLCTFAGCNTVVGADELNEFIIF